MIYRCLKIGRRKRGFRLLSAVVLSYLLAIWYDTSSFHEYLDYPTSTTAIRTGGATSRSASIKLGSTQDSNSGREITAELVQLLRTANANETSPKNFTSNETALPAIKVYCLVGYYGRTSNKIIQVANSLEIIRTRSHAYGNPDFDNEGAERTGNVAFSSVRKETPTKSRAPSVTLNKLALDHDWSKFYLSLFDERHDILLDYFDYSSDAEIDTKCDALLKAEDTHYYRSFHKINPNLLSLKPKLRIRVLAERLLERKMLILRGSSSGSSQRISYTSSSNSSASSSTAIENTPNTSNKFSNVISVHRRWLEGECHRRASNSKENFCVNPTKTSSAAAQYCDIVYDNVTQMMRPFQNEYQVILFTDGQRPEYDETFPVIDNNHFIIQLWMMASSGVHYGNPVSSVDYVVYHWRRGVGMHPDDCFTSMMTEGG